jgi:hypothetical protein
MNWFRKRKHQKLGPVPQDILDAHTEAIAYKKEAAARAPLFRELADNMRHRHTLNGFGEKLEATYQGKGIL